MTADSRRVVTVAAAALLLGAAGATLAQDDDPGSDGKATAAEIARANGGAKDSASTSRKDADAEVAGGGEGAAAAPGIASVEKDDLRVVPAGPTARATRGDARVWLEGSAWLAGPACETDAAGKCTSPHPALDSTWVTLRALDLVDVAHGRRIHSDSIDSTVIDHSRSWLRGTGVPVRWSARVSLAGVRSGSYAGYLLFTREHDTTPAARQPLVVPVTLNVRDPVLWPLLVLGLGFAVILGLRIYAATRLPQHRQYIRLAELEEQILADAELAQPNGIALPFYRKLASLLRASATRIRKKGTADAKLTELAEAEELWVKWRAGRPDWIAGLASDRGHIDTLRPMDTPHARALLNILEPAYLAAPEPPAEGGEEAGGGAARNDGGRLAQMYRAAAVKRDRWARRYLDFLDWLRGQRDYASGIADPVARDRLIGAIDSARDAWNAFATPADDAAADAKLGELRGSVEAARGPAPDAGARRAAPEAAEAPAPDDADTDALLPGAVHARIAAARVARSFYAWTMGALVYLLVVLIGLQETWGTNPSFGADFLGDYLGLAKWVIGANTAAIAVITAFATQWALPWLGGGAGGTAPVAPDAAAESAPLASRGLLRRF
ncbi:MAG TPA: hypothetical protein VFJ82_19495 [Longimicrobium sp.]|nr:hypothetical protein [Longimicrobium sp.]